MIRKRSVMQMMTKIYNLFYKYYYENKNKNTFITKTRKLKRKSIVWLIYIDEYECTHRSSTRNIFCCALANWDDKSNSIGQWQKKLKCDVMRCDARCDVMCVSVYFNDVSDVLMCLAKTYAYVYVRECICIRNSVAIFRLKPISKSESLSTIDLKFIAYYTKNIFQNKHTITNNAQNNFFPSTNSVREVHTRNEKKTHRNIIFSVLFWFFSLAFFMENYFALHIFFGM